MARIDWQVTERVEERTPYVNVFLQVEHRKTHGEGVNYAIPHIFH